MSIDDTDDLPEDPEPLQLHEKDVLPMLKLYDQLRRDTEDKDRVGKAIKAWLEKQEPGTILFDGEAMLEARLQTRRQGGTVDLFGIWKNDRELFKRLLFSGCLRVDLKQVDHQRAQLGDIDRYVMRGEVTSLQVRTIR